MQSEIKTVTREQLLEEAEQLAQHALGTSRAEAFLRLEQGEYRGTIFAAKMAAIRFLLDGDAPLPAAAE